VVEVKQAIFTEWKAKEGQCFEEAFEKNRSELRDKRQEMKDALINANTIKKEIDAAKDRLLRKQADKVPNQDEEMIDEEEYALIKNLKDLKQSYKDGFEKHRNHKMEVISIEHLLQQCKTRLVQSFEEWFDQKYGHLAQKAAEAAAKAAEEGERYDPQEQFDLMEAERLETQHPDALAYHNARKNAARDVRRNKGPVARAGGR